MYKNLNSLLKIIVSLMIVGGIIVYLIIGGFINQIIKNIVYVSAKAEKIAQGNLSYNFV